MREATLCFLVQGTPPHDILLGYKKRGFGAGKYNGFGGKVESDESIEHAALRELAEETGIHVAEVALRYAAKLTFCVSARPEWDQCVHVFMIQDWPGDPIESEEMRPQWFPVDQIPFAQMWKDDAYWLPRVLANRPTEAYVAFADDNETIAELTMTDLMEA